jgi:hypothetical protein
LTLVPSWNAPPSEPGNGAKSSQPSAPTPESSGAWLSPHWGVKTSKCAL